MNRPSLRRTIEARFARGTGRVAILERDSTVKTAKHLTYRSSHPSTFPVAGSHRDSPLSTVRAAGHESAHQITHWVFRVAGIEDFKRALNPPSEFLRPSGK
jgi:hypothetical protein